MPPRNLNIIVIATAISLLCYATHRRARPAMLVGDALNMINAFYVDPVDDQALMIAAMNGMTSTLDEHSEYIPLEAYESFQDNINQEFAGIGIYVSQPEPGKPVRVDTPLVGSPALRAGLLPGDLIVEVDGEDVRAMPLADVSTRLKGPIGTTVDLVVMRQSDAPEREKVRLSVQRGRIELESVVGDYRDEDDGWVYRLRDDSSIGYIRMSSFGEKSVDEMVRAIDSLDSNFRGLVIDLRGNGGGLLNTAVAISDMFLDGGGIVSTRTRGGVIEDRFDAEPGTMIDAAKPVAILIDGNSASASEIVAAALQDNGRAIIVGDRSYGKGTVQNILPLQFGRSALRLTVARYYRPSGANIHRAKDAGEDDEWGVTPDEGMQITLEEADLIKIAKRWREASYPSLIGVDFGQPVAGDETDSEEDTDSSEEAGSDPQADPVDDATIQSALLVDPQLRRAVEAIRDAIEISTPEATAA